MTPSLRSTYDNGLLHSDPRFCGRKTVDSFHAIAAKPTAWTLSEALRAGIPGNYEWNAILWPALICW